MIQYVNIIDGGFGIRPIAFSVLNITRPFLLASDLKYTGTIKQLFKEELNNPSPDFVRFFASRAYSGRITQQVLDQFSEIVNRATSGVIREKVNRLQTALDAEQDESPQNGKELETLGNDPESTQAESESSIVTTAEEVDAFNIIRAIGREVVDVKRKKRFQQKT